MPIQTVLKGRVPIKIWAPEDQVESSAMDQLKNLAALPFVFKHVSAMPDVHLGKGATVGSVIATKGAIIPAAVGVDIGCGMIAVKTPLDYRKVQDKVKEIRHSIERSIPVGTDSNKNLTDSVINWAGWSDAGVLAYMDKKLKDRAIHQLGTLGGGNHFIELCLDETNAVWVMLHSGSRNVGKVTAERHINEAKDIMKKMFINLPDPDLAYFAEDTSEFNAYMRDLNWCQNYASANRVEMMNRVMRELAWYCNDKQPIERLLEVNCHHNYTEREHHYNENVLVTRKGAVRARVGDYGIIPGSMGTRSYIVKGRGNNESFCSCSHGAGRRMSRNKAKEQFTLEDFIKQTEGVECRKDAGVIDEIPGAYKDIDVVMENQKDLVEVVAVLKQFMCVKG